LWGELDCEGAVAGGHIAADFCRRQIVVGCPFIEQSVA
jgi:hypothetical protein